MLYITEQHQALALGGADENNDYLDSCEVYSLKDNSWKLMNTMHQKGKQLGLCKFVKEGKKGDLGGPRIYVYAFGSQNIERIDMTKIPIDSKWEKV